MDKKLTLSKYNKMPLGVCGGIAEYFNIDPTVIRLIFVLIALSSCGFGFTIYILLWAILPVSSSVF